VELKVAVARFVLTSLCPAVVILFARSRAQTVLDDIVEQRPFSGVLVAMTLVQSTPATIYLAHSLGMKGFTHTLQSVDSPSFNAVIHSITFPPCSSVEYFDAEQKRVDVSY
jgi:hypothetical protein